MPIRNSAKALIIRDGLLLANRMQNVDGSHWFDLPGGGQEQGETLVDSVRRECLEEAGVEVEVIGLRFVRDYISKNHEFAAENDESHMVSFMFLCSISETAQPKVGPIPDGSPTGPNQQVAVEWLPIDTLEDYDLYPKSLRPLIRGLPGVEAPVYLGDIN